MKQSQLYALYDSDPESVVVDFLEYVRASYGLPEAPAVLDMGCCPGRLLVPLSQFGWSVTGYEPDSDYAPAAREALRDVPGAEFRQGSFGDLEERAAYDLIAAVNGPTTISWSRQPAATRSSDALGHFVREVSCSWICRTSCGFSMTTANRLRCV